MSSLFKSKSSTVSANPAWIDIGGSELYNDLAKGVAFGNPNYKGKKGVSVENLKPGIGTKIAPLDQDINKASMRASSSSGTWGPNYFQPAINFVKDSTGTWGQDYSADNLEYEGWNDAAAEKYMSPFIKQALQTTSDEMSRTAQIEKLKNSSALATRGAFGGSRHGVVESGINRDLLEQVGNMFKTGMADAHNFGFQAFTSDQGRKLQTGQANEDNRFRAYDTNRTQFNTEKDRLLQAANAMVSLATQHSNVIGQDVDRLLKTGAIKTDHKQKEVNADWDRQKEVVDWLASLINGSASKGSQQVVQQPSMLSQLAGAAAAAGAVASSDIRLKEAIAKIGSKDGVEIVTFRYKDKPGTWLGVIAQQARTVRPDAVFERDGFLMVDYDALGIPFVQVSAQ